MSITFRMGEGSRVGGTGTRTINNITAGVVTPNTGDVVGSLVGDVMEIFGATGTGAVNNGFYTLTLITVNAGADNYTLRPAPITPAGTFTLGSISRLNRANSYTLAATAISSIVLVGSGSLAMLRVAGANFKAVDVQRNDRVIVTGNATAANNGAWYVQEVVHDEVLILRAPDGGTGMTAEAVGTGNISIRRGVHRLTVVNESTLSWDYLLANAVPVVGPTGGSPNFASGAIADYIRKGGAAGSESGANQQLVELQGICKYDFNQQGLGGNSVWQSNREIVVDHRNRSPGTTGDMSTTQFTPTTTGWAGAMELRLGFGSVTDRYAATAPSAWFGIRWRAALNSGWDSGNRGRMYLFGSYWDPGTGNTEPETDGSLVWMGLNSQLCGSIGVGGVVAKGGTVESAINVDGVYASAVAGGSAANILVTSSVVTSALASVAEIGGLLFSPEQTASPLMAQLSANQTTFLDPRQDYDLAVILDNTSASATGQKLYTYNPRYVTKTSPGQQPSLAVGLTVQIFEVNETTAAEVLVLHTLTDSQGRIPNGGIRLRRQFLSGTEVSTLFSHRIVLMGAGFQLVNELIQMTSPVLGDWVVPLIDPDYEGGYNE